MIVQTTHLLMKARKAKYAVGAFNVYNIEGIQAVIQAAEEMKSPVILQVLPSALDLCGEALIAACLKAGQVATVPVAVHLDHFSSSADIIQAIKTGVSSVIADGSHLSFEENIRFTKNISVHAKAVYTGVEAELGRLSGEEDAIKVHQREACLTDPSEAELFVKETGINALAVCIGNVHGLYQHPPDFDFSRLAAIAAKVSIPLVLHGTSGVPDELVLKSIQFGVAKFNVNTEIRMSYIHTLKEILSKKEKIELIDLMKAGIETMKAPVKSKIKLFGSMNQAFQ